ncbi:hypothetical protein BX616_010740, partial [Lobosporangium transversale]
VAIKLIRRQSVDNTPRINKIGREISVLRTIRHPNIISLFDVIETERYIGIVIEYASGGELFDHILAHRYLKERDACRLFAQLMSGVHYLHSKQIVHRDLKLENLLLDRNRNIMITDFGFANQFDGSTRDLMSTSCGSPCYAAPELVISDGLYVGTGVDIWSCGVILYAMLAGYLPFDDDPSNPDGDNINQLYNYILATTLVFPEYISSDARDLLRMMLVPDPAKRCNMRRIMSHRWLRPYAQMFQYSIEDLEAQAIARLNGTVWIPPRQACAVEAAATAKLQLANAGPPRPSADEIMPRRHTIWIESVPDAPTWETGRPLLKPEEEPPRQPIPTHSETAMDIDREVVVQEPVVDVPQQDETMEYVQQPSEPIDIDPTPELPQDHGMDRNTMMDSDHQLNITSEPSTGSPVSMHSNDDHQTSSEMIPSPSTAASLIAKSSVSDNIAAQNREEIAMKLEVAERPKTPERVAEMKAKPSIESTVDMSPTATFSRRTGQHSRIRPTTIHGEPMTQSYNYPTSASSKYHEPLPTPKPRSKPSQENAFLTPPKAFHQSHYQQSSSLLQPPVDSTNIPPVPVPVPGQPESKPVTHSSSMPPPPVPVSPVPDKVQRKGTSSPGRLFGFLGNLSKKHGESNTNTVSSPKITQEATMNGDSPNSSTPATSPSSKKPGSINQVFGRYQHHQQEKASQKGKRRKTLSLVGGADEHHLQQIHGGTRPPMPSAEGLGIMAASSSSNTAQRIMGWLRRKSFAKSDRPQFDGLEQQLPHINGSSPSSIPTQTNRISRAGSVSPQELEMAGMLQSGTLLSGRMSQSGTNAVIGNASTAVEGGRDPALEALLHRLPSNWTDSKLKWHSGAVEISALSSRHPVEIMFEIKNVILRLGMEFRVDSDFKIKCVRRRRNADNTSDSKTHHHSSSLYGTTHVPDDNVSVMSSNMSAGEAWTSARGAGGSVIGGKKKGGIRTLLWRNTTSLSLPSSPPPPVPPLPSSPRALPQVMNGSTQGLSSPPVTGSTATKEIDSDHGVWVSSGTPTGLGITATAVNGNSNGSHQQASTPATPMTTIAAATTASQEGGIASLPSSSTIATTMAANVGPEPLYGEESIDSGEEVRFSIEVCRIKNLPGIYCVDIRRMKGNLWAYKFLYHAVLNTLDLNSKGGYIPTLPDNLKVVQAQ